MHRFGNIKLSNANVAETIIRKTARLYYVDDERGLNLEYAVPQA